MDQHTPRLTGAGWAFSGCVDAGLGGKDGTASPFGMLSVNEDAAWDARRERSSGDLGGGK